MPELICIRLLDAESPAGPLTEAVCAIESGKGATSVHVVDSVSFRQIPNAPFAYWVDEKVRRLFKEFPAFESEGRTARVGLQTGDDFRFVRCWWEVPAGKCWRPFAKGGGVSPYYADVFMKVNWIKEGAELNNSSAARVQNTDYYFRSGAFQTLRSLRLAPHLTPRGCVFSHNGFQFFSDEQDLFFLLGLTNSSFFEALYRLNVGADERPLFVAGVMQLVPVPKVSRAVKDEVAALALSCSINRRRLAVRSERSPWFRRPFVPAFSVAAAVAVERRLIEDLDREYSTAFSKIEALVLCAYGDIPPIIGGHSARSRPLQSVDHEVEESPDNIFAKSAISYAVGLAFGRWMDDRKHPTPEEGLPDDPTEALPAVPPGAGGVAGKLYLTYENIASQGLLDLVRGTLVSQLGPDSETELCGQLGVNDLSSYLAKPTAFFADHLAVYSKSRRYAPIYWPLSTKSGTFTIWVYYHRLDENSLPRLITEVLDPKLRQINEELASLAGPSRATARCAELEALAMEVSEMKTAFQGLIDRGYRPNLNDGVLITACPFYEFFRLPKWQKELKICWGKLARGDYDWAHLAMSMWPERVLKDCAKDRSIAIAHGREDLCPAEAPTAKRVRKPKPPK